MEHLPNRVPHETEYITLVENLSTLMESTSEKILQMKVLATQLKNLELDDPKVTRLGQMSDSMAGALAEAKAASDTYGSNSEEAVGAWADLEKVAKGEELSASHPTYRYNAKALSPHHYFKAVVDPQSLEDAIEGFGRIQHLSRLVAIEKSRIATTE